MPIKTIALSTFLLVSASTVMAAPGYDHDDNVSDRYANELRLKAFEGEPTYQVNVNPQLFVDSDEPVSTQHATKLRLKAFDDSSFAMTKVGQTGGYDFSSGSVADGIGSHHRNHR